MHTVFVGLGSNLGQREEYLRKARKMLSRFLEEIRFSSIYETEPVGYQDQPWFLNQVCLGESTLSPMKLLVIFKEIEKELGRRPGPRFGPRVIDLDLLFYDEWVMVSHLLTIPHPELTERSFVLKPLVEIREDWTHPVIGKTLGEIWREKGSSLTRCLLFKPDQSIEPAPSL